jgi:hypothetical protein
MTNAIDAAKRLRQALKTPGCLISFDDIRALLAERDSLRAALLGVVGGEEGILEIETYPKHHAECWDVAARALKETAP